MRIFFSPCRALSFRIEWKRACVMVEALDLVEKLRIQPGERIRLSDRGPRDKCGLAAKEEAEALTRAYAQEIDTLQDHLYAEGRRALLVILQGTDTSGKDGTIRSVFNA